MKNHERSSQSGSFLPHLKHLITSSYKHSITMKSQPALFYRATRRIQISNSTFLRLLHASNNAVIRSRRRQTLCATARCLAL